MTSLSTVEAFSYCFGYGFSSGFGLPFLIKIISFELLLSIILATVFFLWGLLEELFSLNLDFLLGMTKGKPYYVQKFPTSYLALLLLAWLWIFRSLHILIPSLRIVLEISL